MQKNKQNTQEETDKQQTTPELDRQRTLTGSH